MSLHHTTISRIEDMSPEGSLRISIQEDGDVVVTVVQSNDNGFVVATASCEFCTHVGGGRSPRTLQALKALAVAMAEDSLDSNCTSRNDRSPRNTPPQLLVDRFSCPAK